MATRQRGQSHQRGCSPVSRDLLPLWVGGALLIVYALASAAVASLITTRRDIGWIKGRITRSNPTLSRRIANAGRLLEICWWNLPTHAVLSPACESGPHDGSWSARQLQKPSMMCVESS
jgi:hypothetical protein